MPKYRYVVANPQNPPAIINGGTGFTGAVGELEALSPVANYRALLRDAYTASEMYSRCTANTNSGATTVTMFKNGVSTSLATSTPANTTGVFEDLADEVTFVDTDDFAIETDASSGGHGDSISFSVYAFTMVNTTGRGKTTIGSSAANDTSLRNLTHQLPISGFSDYGPGFGTSERHRVRNPYTFEEMQVIIPTNNIDQAVTWTLRDSGVDTSLQVSVPGDTSGSFFDLTNTGDLAAGDDADVEVVVPSSGMASDSIEFSHMAMSITSAVDNRRLSVAGSAVRQNHGSVTVYTAIEGNSNGTTTENDAKVLARVRFDAENLAIRFSFNDSTAGTGTVALRVNGSNSALTTSIPNGTTGVFEDTTNSVQIVPADEINYIIDMSGLTGQASLAYGCVGIEQKPPEGPEVMHFRSMTAISQP